MATTSSFRSGTPFPALLEKLKEPFPYYLSDDRKNTLLVLGVSLFLAVFMLVFHPLHAVKYNKILLISGITFAVMFGNIVLLPRAFPVLFDTAGWTLGKYLLFTLWHFLLIGIVGPFCLHLLGYYPDQPLAQMIAAFFPRMLMYGTIPMVITTMLLRNVMLRENLSDAVKVNKELEKIREIKNHEPDQAAAHRLTIYSDTRETLTLSLPDLLYIEANDNYSTLYWRNDHGIEKRILRVKLKNIEDQLDNSFALRCHRSYIVNIHAIDHVTGNANGYKLGIAGTSFAIPVSRTKGKEVIEKIRQLRNMFELC